MARLPPEVCIGSLAHPYRKPDNEPWRGPLAIRVQPLDSPTETSCCLTTLISLHACDIMCICWHYYYYYSNIIIIIFIFFLSLLLSFLTSPHPLSPIPAILCIKKNTCQFCDFISFLTDEDPGLGRNVWIKWRCHCPVNVLASGVSNHYNLWSDILVMSAVWLGSTICRLLIHL